MRPPQKRWYAPLLKHPEGTSFFIHEFFPDAQYFLEKVEVRDRRMIRHVRFELDGHVLQRGRSEIDLDRTHPKLIELLRTTNIPLAQLVKGFHVHRTRVRSTTRTREFHFNGDLHAKLFEHFYPLSQKKRSSKK